MFEGNTFLSRTFKIKKEKMLQENRKIKSKRLSWKNCESSGIGYDEMKGIMKAAKNGLRR